MKIYRPLWNEGALLSPQQFQQQSEWETFRSTGVAALASPFAWGVERAEFDERLLGSGLLQITHLRLWLPDGTLVDAAVSDLPPEPRELGASQLSDVVTVVIALPLMQSGLNNVQQESAVADRPLRYREEWVNVQDAFGSEDESVAVARFNLAIRFEHVGYAGRAAPWLVIILASVACHDNGSQIIAAQSAADEEDVWVAVVNKKGVRKENQGNG